MRKILSSCRLSDSVNVGDLLLTVRPTTSNHKRIGLVLEIQEKPHASAYGDSKPRREFKVLESGYERWYTDIELSARFMKP